MYDLCTLTMEVAGVSEVYITTNKNSWRHISEETDFIGSWRWYMNVTITILEIIHRPVSYFKLNSGLWTYGHTKYIRSPLRAQQVNAIYRFLTMVYYYNYQNSRQITFPLFYLKRDISKTRFCLRLQVEPTKLGSIDGSSLHLFDPTE
jgi:hypothetical protein